MSISSIMTASSNAILAFEDGLDVTTANVNHAATYGAKRLNISFKEVFNRVVSGGFASSSGYGVSSNPIQFGGQVVTADTRVDFAQGDISLGGNMTVAINGLGLFIVSPDGGNTKYYTRNGDLRLDPVTKNIVDPSGRMVYGYQLDKNGDPDTSQLVPLNAGEETDVGFLPGGILVGNYTAWYNSTQGNVDQQAQQVVAYTPLNQQLAITTFANVNGLLGVDGTAFKSSAVSGSAVVPVVSGMEWGGQVMARSLEKSNINISVETVNALEYQRAMNASLTMLKLASDELSSFINKIGG